MATYSCPNQCDELSTEHNASPEGGESCAVDEEMMVKEKAVWW
ncbi:MULTISPECIES: hypothetical protein [unclassified Acinetobacter]|nr:MULTISPECIES: hypothetical protein [unclassified Acinetobacter]